MNIHHSSCCKVQRRLQGRKGQNGTFKPLANREIQLCFASAMGKVMLINQRRQENLRLIVGSATNVLGKQTKKTSYGF